MSLRLEQSQKQVLSQKMIQSVNILQMSSQELTDYMKQEVLENPVVDLEIKEPMDKEEDRIKKLEWLASLDEQNRSYYRYDKEDIEDNNGMNNLGNRTTESLADVLRAQLLGKGYSDLEMEIFDYIAQCLDSRGYYTAPLSEITGQFQVSEEKAGECLEIMRNLEPAGVCAGSLRDCLLKQLEGQEDSELEQEIVSNYMEVLGKNQLHIIAKKLKLPLTSVVEAVSHIRELNPRPAQGFDNGELLRYIVPDVTVVKFKDRFEILLNDYSCPVLHVNQEYLKMMKSDCDQDVKDYLIQKVKRAEGIQQCIHRRSSTLLSLTKCIIDAQKAFFLTGEKALKPFRLQEAAEIMGVHESTVSRAIKGKYLQCCWGIYALSYFFPKGVSQPEDEDSVAVLQIKQKIEQIIESEDKGKPYSDQRIAEFLKEQEIDISRRTVAKYRESMHIANCRGRKIFA
ncbi:MAG: RNA polymerase factor sigma-54 [Hespellia sp.]|jgi:RNA polymerase sigma-54 factor|nr:RNA polymerase factor sigma-54 [Hespellia sp.]